MFTVAAHALSYHYGSLHMNVIGDAHVSQELDLPSHLCTKLIRIHLQIVPSTLLLQHTTMERLSESDIRDQTNLNDGADSTSNCLMYILRDIPIDTSYK